MNTKKTFISNIFYEQKVLLCEKQTNYFKYNKLCNKFYRKKIRKKHNKKTVYICEIYKRLNKNVSTVSIVFFLAPYKMRIDFIMFIDNI